MTHSKNRETLRFSGGKSAVQIDRLQEGERQSAIFRMDVVNEQPVDFQRLETILKRESQIPEPVIRDTLQKIQDNIGSLGLEHPNPALVLNWLTGLLRQAGYSLDAIPVQSLDLSLSDVELSIYHPVGSHSGNDQTPEATSQKIADRIKTQFATRRIFQQDVVSAHNAGDIELLYLGAIDRPHDIFLTPEYLKSAGLPASSGAPACGPAKRPEALLSHMIRFTHELQNYFAGDVQWGYANTLFLPFLDDLSRKELAQFVQHMIFEFAQLDTERGGLNRGVILDFDFDMPGQLQAVPAMGPGGKATGKTYGEYAACLQRFNDVVLDVLAEGDYRGNPFHSPHIIYHFNHSDRPWDNNRQKLLETSFRLGNPTLAFSFKSRHFGALGRILLNDPDFLKLVQSPEQLRGFSISSVALNLPRLILTDQDGDFEGNLNRILDLAVSAHRQKRMFISRLMAYGNRGPLQFLRHKIDGRPFLKIDHATQAIQLIGLGEAAALANGSPVSPANALGKKAAQLLEVITEAVDARNRLHKLRMQVSGTKSENLAYRLAFLDLKRFGPDYAPYLLRREDQPHPIYTEGANLLSFTKLHRKERFRLEGALHHFFSGGPLLTLYLKNGNAEDVDIYQNVYDLAKTTGVEHLALAPDFHICTNCYLIFQDPKDDAACPDCHASLVSPYGLCQAWYSPVQTWCLGKRAEWRIRHRSDTYTTPVQAQLPI